MASPQARTSDLAYLKQLVSAGMSGIASARQETGGGVFTPPLPSAVWTPAMVGAALGALGTHLRGNRKTASVAVGGLVGSAIGCAAALAWTSRRFTGCAARRVVRGVNAARDAHWLELNPIDYA
jgi:hypothetical protein